MSETALQKEGEKLKLIKIYVIHSKVTNRFPFQTSEVQMRINSFSKLTETIKKFNSPKFSFNVIIKGLENNI